jgi:hypothetical protein
MDALLFPLSSLSAPPVKIGSTEFSEIFQSIHPYMQKDIPKQRRHKPEAISVDERFMSIQYRQSSSNIYQWISLLHHHTI